MFVGSSCIVYQWSQEKHRQRARWTREPFNTVSVCSIDRRHDDRSINQLISNQPKIMVPTQRSNTRGPEGISFRTNFTFEKSRHGVLGHQKQCCCDLDHEPASSDHSRPFKYPYPARRACPHGQSTNLAFSCSKCLRQRARQVSGDIGSVP